MLTERKRCTRLAICGLVCVAGCYRYAATSIESVHPGQAVRARVSGAQAERLEPVLGNTGRSVEGRLLESGDSGIVIAVASPVSPEGATTVSHAYQRVAVPRTDIEEMELRHLDGFRTTLAVVGAAAGIAVGFGAVSQVVQLGSGGDRPSPNKNRVPRVIPLFRVRLSR